MPNHLDIIAAYTRGPVLYFDNGPTAPNTGGVAGLNFGQGMVGAIIEPGEPLFDLVDPAFHNDYNFLPQVPDDLARDIRVNGGNSAGAFGRSIQILDRSIFDYDNINMGGRNDRRTNDFKTYNIALEQQFMDGQAAIEIAFDHQEFDNGGYDFL